MGNDDSFADTGPTLPHVRPLERGAGKYRIPIQKPNVSQQAQKKPHRNLCPAGLICERLMALT